MDHDKSSTLRARSNQQILMLGSALVPSALARKLPINLSRSMPVAWLNLNPWQPLDPAFHELELHDVASRMEHLHHNNVTCGDLAIFDSCCEPIRDGRMFLARPNAGVSELQVPLAALASPRRTCAAHASLRVPRASGQAWAYARVQRVDALPPLPRGRHGRCPLSGASPTPRRPARRALGPDRSSYAFSHGQYMHDATPRKHNR